MRSQVNRREFLSVMGGAAAVALTPQWLLGQTPSSPQAARPNIVLIMADDMGFSDIGCYGSEIATPHLDRLAKGGVRFSQFYNCARCCPTRASLLTGLYPHQAGIGHMVRRTEIPGYRGALNDRCVTIAEVLRSTGYQTFIAGKWHVGSRPGQLPLDRGFDRFYGFRWGASGYFGTGEGEAIEMLDREPVKRGKGWYSTDAYSDWAVRFLDQAAGKDAPFFLYVPYTAPHWPLHAKPADIAKYKGKYMGGWDELRAARHKRLIEMGIVDKAWPLSSRDVAEAWKTLPPDKQKSFDLKMAVYAAQVDCMDQGIGRILAKLKAMGADKNTLVMFLSDNGGCAEYLNRKNRRGPIGTHESFASYGLPWANASNTPFRRFKHFTHEGGIATPLIAYWPGVIAADGAVTHQVGHVIDILATCADVAGATYPRTFKDKPITPLEGKSLLPIFRGKERAGHEALYWEHEGNLAVRQGKWKLVQRYKYPLELFDMAADRTELKDLASANPEKLKELSTMYDAWAKRCKVQPWKQIGKLVVKKRRRKKPPATVPAKGAP